MLVASTSYPAPTRLVPQVVGIPACLLSASRLIAALQLRATGRSPLDTRRELAAVGWVVGLAVAVVVAGFLIGGPLTVALYMWRRAHLGVVGCVAAATLAFVVLSYGFEAGLGLVLFRGIVQEGLG
jgi:hypothetical protein